MKTSLKQLYYIQTAARVGSISGAAVEHTVSVSSIRAAIELFEAEFDTKLFVRTPSRGLELTPTGRELIQKIRRLLTQVEDFSNDASSHRNALKGELYIGCFSPPSPHFLVPILKELSSRHPGVKFRLFSGNILEMQKYLLSGIVDIIFTNDLVENAAIEMHYLSKTPSYILLPANDPRSLWESIKFQDLQDTPAVLLELPETRGYFDSIFKAVEFEPDIWLRLESYEMVRSMVGAGFGFSVLNTRPLIDTTYGGSRVACVPLNENIPAPSLVLGQRAQETPSRILEEFIKFCRAFFASDQAKNHLVVGPK